MARKLPLLVALIGALVLAAPAAAVPPAKRAKIEAHQHGTLGHDWHVQVEVDRKGTKLSTLVLYAQECDETTFLTGVPIAPDGSFDATGFLPKKKGTWEVKGIFTDARNATGTWSVSKPGVCETGERPWTGGYNPNHIMLGNFAEYPGAAVLGSSKNARRMRNIRRATMASAHKFDTIEKAERRGYVLQPGADLPGKCPNTYHMRKHGVDMWGDVFDADHPQSLVFWCDSQSQWTLIAYMYRAPGDKRPNTYGDLVQWHKHGKSATWMTHVWLVEDTAAAWATCIPWAAFERFGIIRYETYTSVLHNSLPCSDTDKHGLP